MTAHHDTDLHVVVTDGRTGQRLRDDGATGAEPSEGVCHDDGPAGGSDATGPDRPRGILARVGGVALTGLDGAMVRVEAAVGGGLSQIKIIGLPDAAVREAADRIRLACGRSGFELPGTKVVVNLAPAGIRKEGPGFDLPVALAVLVAARHLAPEEVADVVAIGEVGLDGAVRSSPGTLPAATTVATHEPSATVLVAADAASEAALVAGLDVVGVSSLREAVAVLAGRAPRPEPPRPPEAVHRVVDDLAEVRGQQLARRGIEIAAAGGHHVLLLGPPGCGKSMLARRLPGILPPLEHDQALEVAAVASIVGDGGGLDLTPPFRDPHHATSTAGLVGGGSGVARPGELTRAHHGVLFLDEVLETPRATLDALRQPLEDGRVVLVRSRSRVVYPARVQLVAAANPCPCGHAGSSPRPCTCRPDQVQRYRSRLSGPLLDRIDLHLELEAVSEEVLVGPPDGEPSAAVAARVHGARARASARWQEAATDGPPGPILNRDAPVAAIRDTAAPGAQMRLARAVSSLGWSARTFDRCLRVARTIADLAGADVVDDEHVDEAIAYRVDTVTGGVA